MTLQARSSNAYLHVDAIRDPRLKLRQLRKRLAGMLWEHHKARHEARVRANDDIDAGYKPGLRHWNDEIKRHNAAILALRLVAVELKEHRFTGRSQ